MLCCVSGISLSDYELQRLFRRFDVNDDNRVSFSEFEAFLDGRGGVSASASDAKSPNGRVRTYQNPEHKASASNTPRYRRSRRSGIDYGNENQRGAYLYR